MKQIEHTEQVNFINWWKYACCGFNIHESCLFAIPNGGQRNIITARKLKAEGVRAGIPDLFFAYPNKEGEHGLFIEMKKPKGGRVSEEQKNMIETFSSLGYRCVVCHGWLEAKNAIEHYLGKSSSVSFDDIRKKAAHPNTRKKPPKTLLGANVEGNL